MVVEDDAAIRESLTEQLTAEHYEVVACATGEQAVTCYRDGWKSIDCVILDMVLSDSTGVGVYAELISIDSTAKVIAISGSGLTAEVESLQKNGVAVFLTKPLEYGKLLAIVDRMVDLQPKV
jgi:DNA-binding NtrC family response regulator